MTISRTPAKLRGKAVLVHSEPMKTWEDLFGEYQRVPVVVEESVKRGVRAILIQSTRPSGSALTGTSIPITVKPTACRGSSSRAR